jgi:drug/metabolite transporter (DMT)-like permease
MNRVWKKFLTTVFKTIGMGLLIFLVYAIICTALGFVLYLFGMPIEPIITISTITPMCLIFIGYILHETYQNAKSEVEYENQKIIRNIKTGY